MRDFIHAGMTVEQVAVDAGLVHYHRAAFIRFTVDLANEQVPTEANDYLCECGTPVTTQPICMFCGQDAHHLCWNHEVIVPGACPCPCWFNARTGAKP